MNNQQKIVYINVDKIFPHPHNPRKELGDISELSESIKVAGILQNLTVVPFTDADDNIVADKYTAIIGHRRLAGAKLAQLDEVPCIISEMDDKQQISTMLLENMQRSDLTTYEQAEGFQMMLDMGVALSDISNKTGFSESTVRRRVKLLDLDRDKFKQSEQRGATLNDYLELDKINDPDLKNKVLDTIGTGNFNFTLQSAIQTEKTEQVKQKTIAFLNTFATEVNDTQGLQYKNSFYDFSKIIKPDDADTTEYFYIIKSYCVTLYVKSEEKDENQTEAQLAQQHENDRRIERENKLKELTKTAYNLRKDFVKSRTATTIRKHIGAVTEFLAENLINDSFRNISQHIDTDLLSEMLEITIDGSNGAFSFEQVRDSYFKSQEVLLFTTLYCRLCDNGNVCYRNRYTGKYEENQELDQLYSLLEKLGYMLSDDEKALKDGTHILFAESEDEE